MRAAMRLHMKCIKAVLKSPLRYFDITPIGMCFYFGGILCKIQLQIVGKITIVKDCW